MSDDSRPVRRLSSISKREGKAMPPPPTTSEKNVKAIQGKQRAWNRQGRQAPDIIADNKSSSSARHSSSSSSSSSGRRGSPTKKARTAKSGITAGGFAQPRMLDDMSAIHLEQTDRAAPIALPMGAKDDKETDTKLQEAESEHPQLDAFLNPTHAITEPNPLFVLQLPTHFPVPDESSTGDLKEKQRRQVDTSGERPYQIPGKRSSMKSGDKQDNQGVSQLPSCELGELIVRKSGRVQMKIGDVLYDVDDGIQSNFYQEVFAVTHAPVYGENDAMRDDDDGQDPNTGVVTDPNALVTMGPVAGKLVVSMSMDSFQA